MCCEGGFSEFFGLMLFDRGSEFDSIEAMEASKETRFSEHEPIGDTPLLVLLLLDVVG